MKHASISTQPVSLQQQSFGMIIGTVCLLSPDETSYCDSFSQPGFKCVLITTRLRS